jgi:hypothetical protein
LADFPKNYGCNRQRKYPQNDQSGGARHLPQQECQGNYDDKYSRPTDGHRDGEPHEQVKQAQLFFLPFDGEKSSNRLCISPNDDAPMRRSDSNNPPLPGGELFMFISVPL